MHQSDKASGWQNSREKRLALSVDSRPRPSEDQPCKNASYAARNRVFAAQPALLKCRQLHTVVNDCIVISCGGNRRAGGSYALFQVYKLRQRFESKLDAPLSPARTCFGKFCMDVVSRRRSVGIFAKRYRGRDDFIVRPCFNCTVAFAQRAKCIVQHFAIG
jgi:hypothetical protein